MIYVHTIGECLMSRLVANPLERIGVSFFTEQDFSLHLNTRKTGYPLLQK